MTGDGELPDRAEGWIARWEWMADAEGRERNGAYRDAPIELGRESLGAEADGPIAEGRAMTLEDALALARRIIAPAKAAKTEGSTA